mmetsp:Transcript_36684/g.86786  ORF Transcript_36684/g.86786 Transcript_36684/m.86786 type:complete len:327 (+) Transcript_36684:464-1444(+)
MTLDAMCRLNFFCGLSSTPPINLREHAMADWSDESDMNDMFPSTAAGMRKLERINPPDMISVTSSPGAATCKNTSSDRTGTPSGGLPERPLPLSSPPCLLETVPSLAGMISPELPGLECERFGVPGPRPRRRIQSARPAIAQSAQTIGTTIGTHFGMSEPMFEAGPMSSGGVDETVGSGSGFVTSTTTLLTVDDSRLSTAEIVLGRSTFPTASFRAVASFIDVDKISTVISSASSRRWRPPAEMTRTRRESIPSALATAVLMLSSVSLGSLVLGKLPPIVKVILTDGARVTTYVTARTSEAADRLHATAEIVVLVLRKTTILGSVC